MARSRGYRSRSTSRRSVTWGLGATAADENVSATGKTIWTQGAVSGVSETMIVRTRGYWEGVLKAATAAGDGFIIGLGLAVVTSEAFAVGVTVVPGPLTDNDWDGWFWHHVTGLRASTATIADGVNAVGAFVRVDIDSKAMRKIDVGEVVMGIVEVIESGTATMEFNADTRQLIKLG